MLVGIIHSVVHTKHDDHIFTFCRRRNYYLLNAAAEMFPSVFSIGKTARRLDHDIGSDGFPIDRRWVLLGKNFETVAFDTNIISVRYDLVFKVTHNRVILEQVRERFGIGKVVYRYEM